MGCSPHYLGQEVLLPVLPEGRREVNLFGEIEILLRNTTDLLGRKRQRHASSP